MFDHIKHVIDGFIYIYIYIYRCAQWAKNKHHRAKIYFGWLTKTIPHRNMPSDFTYIDMWIYGDREPKVSPYDSQVQNFKARLFFYKYKCRTKFHRRRLHPWKGPSTQASTLTYFSTCPFGQLTKKSTCPTQSFSCPKKLIKFTKTRE